jgi:hypothetical protein
LKLFQEWEEGRIKGNGEGVNSSMIYGYIVRNFINCHNVPPPSTTIKKMGNYGKKKRKDQSQVRHSGALCNTVLRKL